MDKKTLRAWGFFANFGYTLGFIPYRYTSKGHPGGNKAPEHPLLKKKWIFNGSPQRRCLVLVSLAVQGLYQVYLIGRSIQAGLDDNVPSKEKIQIFSVTGVYVLLDYVHWIALRHYGEHGKYLNCVLETVHELNGSKF